MAFALRLAAMELYPVFEHRMVFVSQHFPGCNVFATMRWGSKCKESLLEEPATELSLLMNNDMGGDSNRFLLARLKQDQGRLTLLWRSSVEALISGIVCVAGAAMCDLRGRTKAEERYART